MSIDKIINPTKLDIVFIMNYRNPDKNSLMEYREDLTEIEKLKRYVKSFYIKKNEIAFKKLFNNFLFLSNIFPVDSYDEVLNYIGYKYFLCENELFEFYVNVVFCFFDIEIDKMKIRDEYLMMLKRFIPDN